MYMYIYICTCRYERENKSARERLIEDTASGLPKSTERLQAEAPPRGLLKVWALLVYLVYIYIWYILDVSGFQMRGPFC